MTKSKDQNIRHDWTEAGEICRRFPNKKCLEAAAALMVKFGQVGQLLAVNTIPYTLGPYICHRSLPSDSISDTGRHFAVQLHGRVFDNLTPEGATMEEWMGAFEFATKQFAPATFADIEIAHWTHKQFRDFLKLSNRTRTGRLRAAG